MTPILTLVAVGTTALMLAVLALRDPKRVRTVARTGGRRGVTLGTPARIALGAASMVPGVMLGLGDQWPAFILWLGMSCAVGWALTFALAPPPKRERAKRRSNAQHASSS